MSEPTSSTEKKDVTASPPEQDAPAASDMPPIPDGGLADSMPVWLQQAPSRPTQGASAEPVDTAALAASLELPSWLTALSKRVEESKQGGATIGVPHVEPAAIEAEPPAPADAPVEAPIAAEDETASVTASESDTDEPAEAAPPAAETPPPMAPVPVAAAVDPEAFLRGGEVAAVPEPRSKVPYIVTAIAIVVLAALMVWYLGS